MKIIIKQIKHENKVSQSGKQFESCRIQTVNKNGEETWVSGFGSSNTHSWSDGNEVDIDITQTDKGYFNFKENKDTKKSPDKTLELLQKIDRKIDLLLGKSIDSQNSDDVTVEELPF